MTGHLGYESTGPERAARPEQRPGAERRGREPVVPPRLPGRSTTGDRAEVLGGVGRRGARDARLPARPDDVRPPRRADQGALPHRREPGADRAERAPRRGGPRAARLPRLAGHLPERHDRAKYADVVLPASSFAEKDGTFTNTERRVNRVRARGAVPGRGARGLARSSSTSRARSAPTWPEYPDAESVWDEFADLAPNWNGIRYDRLEESGSSGRAPTATIPARRTSMRQRRRGRAGAASSSRRVPAADRAARLRVPVRPLDRPHALPLQLGDDDDARGRA